MVGLIKSKKGDWELDELGKVIFYLVVLIVIIAIIWLVIKGEFATQGDKAKDVFDMIK